MNCKMVLSLAVLVLICTATLWGQKPTDEDPYLLWQTTDPLGYSGFVIHPNGNIIANRNCEFFEIDGNTGALLKTYPVHYGFSEILSVSVAPDGKYFAAIYAGGGDSVIIYITDYQTGDVYRKVRDMGDNIRFMSDSKRLLITTFDRGHPNASLSVYNLEDESFHNFGAGFSSEGFAELAMSDDGKYFATGGRKIEQVGLEEKTFVYLRLWDAQTMKPIKQLDKIEGDNEVRSIKFSTDGKYVGFQVGTEGVFIYNLVELKFERKYDLNNTEYPPSAFCFLLNNLIAITSLANGQDGINRYNIIKNIINDEIVYRYFGKISSGLPSFVLLDFNPVNNSFVLTGGHLFAFDLNKMLTSVNEPKKELDLLIHYQKGTLILNNLNSISSRISITISDISGRVIRKLNSQVTNSEFKIPILLPNGTYLLHIQDGNKEYSSKFLVTE